MHPLRLSPLPESQRPRNGRSILSLNTMVAVTAVAGKGKDAELHLLLPVLLHLLTAFLRSVIPFSGSPMSQFGLFLKKCIAGRFDAVIVADHSRYPCEYISVSAARAARMGGMNEHS